MGGSKWRVEQNGQFLGHHSGHTPLDAIKKACRTYGQVYNISYENGDTFICTRGAQTEIVEVIKDEG